MPRKPLDEPEVVSALTRLPDWSLDRGKLHRDFRFRGFVEAFGFMTQSALVAENLGHHPEWFNAGPLVRVHLTTHDAGGVTDLDLTLAAKMDRLAASFCGQPRVEPVA